MNRLLLVVTFAILVVASLIGGIEGVRLYSEVEANDERFVGMSLFGLTAIGLMLMALHGAMFQKPAR